MMIWTDSIETLRGVRGSQVALVVAHSDDETFMAEILMRFPEALVMHVTDSAPDDRNEWKDLPTREAYARLRAQELERALDAVGHRGQRVALGVKDATAIHEVRNIRLRMRYYFACGDTKVVFTHTYEGGHPDHDAVAAAVHGQPTEPMIFEAPYYRMEGAAQVWQKFIPDSSTAELTVQLSREGRKRKDRMLRAHRSQSRALQHVIDGIEFYRRAPAYDFTRPPNGGNLAQNYARAGIAADSWKSLVQ
jgi:N-acetylglucosamine malate deacetylase 2